MSKQRGFTLLELLITISILGIVFVVGASSGSSSWKTKRAAQNILTTILNEMGTLKNLAISQNTTSRMTLVNAAGVYTLTTYYSATPTTTCSSAGTWTTIVTKQIDVNDEYEVTGTALSNLCFHRDGSSSGGTISIAPQDSSSSHKTYDIDITISTGFIDVTES